jgi:hypothetical protein
LRGGAVDDADIGRVRHAHHRIDLLVQFVSVQAGVILQRADRPVRLYYIVGDVRLSSHDRLGNVFVPGNYGGETVLQCRHFADECPEFTVGSAGGATRPDTSVEDFGPLVLSGR